MNELHYAVVVGINRYPEIGALTSPKADATRFAKWLKRADGGGLPDDNVSLITVEDSAVPEGTSRECAVPTKRDAHLALDQYTKRCREHVQARRRDWRRTRLYVYLSGHGLAPNPREAALLFADAGPGWFGENIPCALALDFYESARYFHEVVFFADCCRYRVNEAQLTPLPFDRRSDEHGPVVKMLGLATLFGDPAWEEPPLSPDGRRSFFTKALLEGLDGAAAEEGSGRIDSNSLAGYVRNRTLELTRNLPRPQEPVVVADPANPIVFRKRAPAPPPAQLEVRIVFRSGFRGDVFLLDGNFRPLDRHRSNGGSWVTRVNGPGLYRVHPAAGDEPAPPNAPNPFIDRGIFSVVGEGIDVEV